MNTTAKKVLLGVIAATVATIVAVSVAESAGATAGPGVLVTDSGSYSPDRTTGGATHYYTPGGTVTFARNDVHTWTGNGSEHLPCAGGELHWISNKNVLTISHCTPGQTTTTSTTEPPVTTLPPETTQPPATTQPPEQPTTTVAEVTTTVAQVTTTLPPSAPTTQPPAVSIGTAPVPPAVQPTAPAPTPTGTLPETGSSSWLLVFLAAGALLTGGALILAARRDR